jgi:hypothetical protein
LKELDRWIRQYDNFRTNPDMSVKDGWTSTKYDLTGHWSDVAEIWIPELNCKFGPACSALKKSWFHLKLLKRRGEYAGDIQWRIQKIQRSLGIPITQFENMPYKTEQLEEGLTPEERELRNEELESANDEAEKESDDWWII